MDEINNFLKGKHSEFFIVFLRPKAKSLFKVDSSQLCKCEVWHEMPSPVRLVSKPVTVVPDVCAIIKVRVV